MGTTDSYFVSGDASGRISWFTTVGGVARNLISSGSLRVKWNEWNFFSGTYTGSAVYLYLNGAKFTEEITGISGALGVNTGILRIGAYFSGALGITFFGELYRPRIYNVGMTLAEHRDRMFSDITSPALQAGLVLDAAMTEGAGSTVTDLSGLGNHATMGASASWTSDSPFKARKRSVNANMVKNGDFEYAPPFVGATATSPRWIDGTGGGSTTNDLFGWYHIVGISNYKSSFDTSVSRSGSGSLKIESLDTTGRGRAMTAPFEATTTEALVRQYGIPAQQNTDYRTRCYIKTNNVQASSITVQVQYYRGDGVAISTSSAVYQATTQDWTLFEQVFTTSPLTQYLVVKFTMAVAGSVGQAWLDDLTLTPVYPEGRVPANGNLVKNFDFEVAPTFVAAQTTSGRWIDGNAAGSLTNSTYKYAFSSKSGTGQVQFDTSVSHSGVGSMKVSTTDVSSNIEVSNVIANTAANMVFAIPVSPGVSYTGTYWMKTNYVSGDATNGANMDFITRNAASTALTVNATTKVKTTTDWTQYTVTFTADATANFVTLRMRVDGLTGAPATLIMDAWFDDIYLAPVYPEGRVPANGNLVKNFDFEVAPTFVAATSTNQRWIDGSSAGSTTNATFKWGIAGSGTYAGKFDNSVAHSGSYSMKLSTLATASQCSLTNTRTTNLSDISVYGFSVLPNTSYTLTGWMKTNYVSGDATNGAALAVVERNAAGTAVITNTTTYIKTTTDWTQYTTTFTTAASTAFLTFDHRVYGHQGTATLIMDAWFDDIYLGQ